jgi:LysM repeat protein
MRKDILTGLPQFAEGGQVSAYEIQTGDTLSNIAKQHGTTVEQLATDNEISDPNMIYAGRTINVPSAAGIIEPAAAPISMPEPEVAPSPTAKPSMLAEQVEQAYTAGSEAVTEGLEAVSTSVGKGVGALRRMLGTDLGGSGRTAENTAGSLRNSETTVDIPDFSPTQAVADGKTWTLAGAEEGLNRVVETVDSVVDYFKNIDFGFSSLDEVAKANAAPETDISDVKLPDFSSAGRTAENTAGTTAEPKATEISMLGDMTIDQIADAVASPEVDLSDTSIKMPDFSSKGRTAENTTGATSKTNTSLLPENALAFAKFYAGNSLGLEGAGKDIDVKNFGTKQQDVLRQAMLNAAKDNRDYITYSDYPDMASGERPDEFYRAKRKDRSLTDIVKESLLDPVFEMFTTTGVFKFETLKDGKFNIIPDQYDFNASKNRKGKAKDEYGSLVHSAQDMAQTYTFNVKGKL